MPGKLTETFQVLKLLDDILLEAGSCKQNIVKVHCRVNICYCLHHAIA